jgi:hypothetical protein
MGAIIWLASYPKSGNTWLRAFLHNLLRNPSQPTDINQLDRFALGDSQKMWYAEVADRPLEDMEIADIVALTPAVHQRMTQAFPDSIFVKTHNFLGELFDQQLITMSCSAGAMYVIRNPLDISVSLAHHFGCTIDEAIDMLNDPNCSTPEDAVNVPQYYGDWSHHVRSWTGQENTQLLVLRYEDMSDKPNKTFARVAKFIGVSPPRQRLQKAIKFSSFKVLQGQEKKHGFKERPVNAESFFRQGRPGQWRQALSAAQIARISDYHHEQMARFGYMP